MSKLKYAFAFPVIQLLVACALVLIADRTPFQPVGDGPFFPTAFWICRGLNAPAFLLLIPFGATWYSEPPLEPFAIGRILYLSAVAVIWYFAGRSLDPRPNPAPPQTRARAFALYPLLLLVAGLLAYLAVHDLRYPPGKPVPAGPALTLGWSLVLSITSIRALIRAIRHRS
jgi:hypothetical protein